MRVLSPSGCLVAKGFNIVMINADMRIPLVINTLENCFRNICVVGDGQNACNLYKYLSKNDGIVVMHIEGVHAEETIHVNNDTEIVISFLESCKVIKRNQKDVYCVTYKELMEGNIDSFIDIYLNIIPRLIEEQVRVLVVKTPDLSGYKPKIPLLCSIAFFRLILRYSSRHDKIILKHFGQDKLIDEFMKTKADKSKGFLKVYGNGKYINYDDGFRRVPSSSLIDNSANHVYLFGFCISANPMLPDDDTIAAKMQRALNSDYRVASRGNDGSSINLVMRETVFKKGDVAVIFTSHNDCAADRSGAEIVTLDNMFYKVPRLWKHIADNSYHCDSFIANKIAGEVVGKIKEHYYEPGKKNIENGIVLLGPSIRRPPEVEMIYDGMLQEYISKVERIYPKERWHKNKVGAIVMNCNPFSLGHQYLIETARKMVDDLLVFVVEEDKSIFKFNDRFVMVKEGTKEYENVYVVPSGKFIISSTTLPGYFDKKHLGTIEVSAGEDLEIFATISKELGISVRFAGEEPNDEYTNSYNKAMSNKLPMYGIQFVEIPRVTVKGSREVVSATKVRECLESGDKELLKLIPLSTYMILREKGYLNRM